jgi:hypothetical protein
LISSATRSPRSGRAERGSGCTAHHLAHVDERENSAAAALIAGEREPFGVRKSLILPGFSWWHGVC